VTENETMSNTERPNERARLEAILLAALGESDDWRVLIELALSAGQGALAQRFAQALAEERRHLACARTWADEVLTPSGRMRAHAAASG
jgi:hypothetical protein